MNSLKKVRKCTMLLAEQFVTNTNIRILPLPYVVCTVFLTFEGGVEIIKNINLN